MRGRWNKHRRSSGKTLTHFSLSLFNFSHCFSHCGEFAYWECKSWLYIYIYIRSENLRINVLFFQIGWNVIMQIYNGLSVPVQHSRPDNRLFRHWLYNYSVMFDALVTRQDKLNWICRYLAILLRNYFSMQKAWNVFLAAFMLTRLKNAKKCSTTFSPGRYKNAVIYVTLYVTVHKTSYSYAPAVRNVHCVFYNSNLS